MKINDIQKKLEPTINIRERIFKKLKVEKKKKHSFTDIQNGLKKIDLRKRRFIKIEKKKKGIFDSIINKKYNKTISPFNKISKEIILKNSLSTEGFNSLQKRKITKKKKKVQIFKKKEIKRRNPFIINFLKINFYLKISILLLGFMFLLLVDKILVEKLTKDSYYNLTEIKDEKDINLISNIVTKSNTNLLISKILFSPINLVDAEDIKNGNNVINGGYYLTNAIKDGIEIYKSNKEIKTPNPKSGEFYKDLYLTDTLKENKEVLISIEENLEKALGYYKSITDLGDENLNNKIKLTIEKIEEGLDLIKIVNNNFDSILQIAGDKKEKKYLIVFQNSDEIRPLGGFMGSMGIVSIFKGEIKDFEKRDIYDIEWDLKKADYNKLPAPKGIDKLTEFYGLRDSNYYIDTKRSSEDIKFFVNKSGINIDGILYINQNIVSDFLTILGEVEFEKIGEKINSSNFSIIFSLIVEAKLYKQGAIGSPKSILFDFIDVFKSEVYRQKKYEEYIKIIKDNIEKREIIFYSFDENILDFTRNLGISGEIDYEKPIDFAYPVFTSISGNKSDRYMKRIFKKEIKINKDSSIDTNLTIYQSHNFNKDEENLIRKLAKKFNIKDMTKTLIIQGQARNKQFVRVLLPKNAIIEKSKNYEILNYKNKNVVQFFTETKVLQTSVIEIKYKLPNLDKKPYDFKFYKQPGIKQYWLEVTKDKKKTEKNGIKTDFVYSREE